MDRALKKSKYKFFRKKKKKKKKQYVRGALTWTAKKPLTSWNKLLDV